MISELYMGLFRFFLLLFCAGIRLWYGFVFSAEQTLLQQLLQPPDTSWNPGSHQVCRDVGQHWKEPPGKSCFWNYFWAKKGIFCWYLFCKSKTRSIFIFFWICLQTVWINFLKRNVYDLKNSSIFEVRKIIIVKISEKIKHHYNPYKVKYFQCILLMCDNLLKRRTISDENSLMQKLPVIFLNCLRG